MLTCNVVMEGGGVKGIGLAGALETLAEQGYNFRRIAGTSAGAVVSSLLAAGMQPQQMAPVIQKIDFKAFADKGLIDQFGLFGRAISVIFEKGIYEGNFLTSWLKGQLAELGVETFADLRLTEDWAQGLPANQRYKLVVLATDVSRGKLVRLPWDYAQYGLDPDKQLVADAIRASIAIPFYYEPFKIKDNFIVDGGVISNFPVWIFEQSRHSHAKTIPTLGIKLSAKPEALTVEKIKNTSNTVNYAASILSTILSAQDQIHLNDPCTVRRTIFVDTGSIKSTNFDISKREQEFLFNNGRQAAEEFLKDWDYQQFLKQCRVH